MNKDKEEELKKRAPIKPRETKQKELRGEPIHGKYYKLGKELYHGSIECDICRIRCSSLYNEKIYHCLDCKEYEINLCYDCKDYVNDIHLSSHILVEYFPSQNENI